MRTPSDASDWDRPVAVSLWVAHGSATSSTFRLTLAEARELAVELRAVIEEETARDQGPLAFLEATQP